MKLRFELSSFLFLPRLPLIIVFGLDELHNHPTAIPIHNTFISSALGSPVLTTIPSPISSTPTTTTFSSGAGIAATAS